MPMRGVAIGVVMAMAGCTGMQSVEPAQFIPQHKPTVVSVWTAPDRVTVVADPNLDGDTLRGVVLEAPWAVPLKEVVRVEAEAPSLAKTGLLVATTISAVGALYLITGGRGAAKPPCDPEIGCNSVKTAP
jgi:hypothetical protein